MDTEYPMQVEFEFKDKETYPELKKMYNFFAELNDTIGEFVWVTVYVYVTEEEARSYFPDGRGSTYPRQTTTV